MNKWLKVACVVALLVVAGSAAALPADCENCTCVTYCTARCSVGGSVITCGQWGVCRGTCRAVGIERASATTGAETDAADPLLEQILGQPAACDPLSRAKQAIASAD